MKSLGIVLSILMLFLCTVKTQAYAKTEISGQASVAAMSHYVWRGIKLSNSYVIQPSVSFRYGDLGINLWANWDSDLNNQGEHTETDLTLNFTFPKDTMLLDIGYIYYALEGISNDTQEVYLAVRYEKELIATFTVYYDYDQGDGMFAVATLGQSVNYGSMISNLSLSSSYNYEHRIMGNDVNGSEFSGFYNSEISGSLTFPVTRTMSFETKVIYTFPLSDDSEYAIESLSNDGDSEFVYGGITVLLLF